VVVAARSREVGGPAQRLQVALKRESGNSRGNIPPSPFLAASAGERHHAAGGCVVAASTAALCGSAGGGHRPPPGLRPGPSPRSLLRGLYPPPPRADGYAGAKDGPRITQHPGARL
jgi:hypothetical protein